MLLIQDIAPLSEQDSLLKQRSAAFIKNLGIINFEIPSAPVACLTGKAVKPNFPLKAALR